MGIFVCFTRFNPGTTDFVLTLDNMAYGDPYLVTKIGKKGAKTSRQKYDPNISTSPIPISVK